MEQVHLGAFEHGKVPPQALDLEEMVLGSIMSEKSLYICVSEILTPEVFYKEINQIIYSTIETLARDNKTFAYLMVIQQLKKTGELEFVGGPYYITLLVDKFTLNPKTVEEGGLIMKEKFMKRQIILMSSIMIDSAYDDVTDPFDLLDTAQTHLNDVVHSNQISTELATTGLFMELNKHIDNASALHDKGKLSGIPCTLSEVNKCTGGWQPGNMITIASRPSMGKSALTKAMIKGVTQTGEPVLMFSLEMPRIELMARFASETADVTAKDILAGKCTDKMDLISETPTEFYGENGRELLIIDDTASLTIKELKTRAKRIISIRKPKLIIIDYLQLIKGTNDRQNREQEISEVSRGIKILAKETGLPIIVLSQLSRAVETRNPPRPKLADLRESGSIEQDSDIVIFLYREWYYYKSRKDESFSETNLRGETVSTEYLAEIIVAKHRMGALKNIPVKFTDWLTKFEDWPQVVSEVPDDVRSPLPEEKEDAPF